MTTLTQANRDTYLLDIKLQILPLTDFKVWSCTTIAPNTILYHDKWTFPPAKGHIYICYNHSKFQMLLEIWNFAEKSSLYFIVRIITLLPLLGVSQLFLKVPTDNQDNPIPTNFQYLSQRTDD